MLPCPVVHWHGYTVVTLLTAALPTMVCEAASTAVLAGGDHLMCIVPGFTTSVHADVRAGLRLHVRPGTGSGLPSHVRVRTMMAQFLCTYTTLQHLQGFRCKPAVPLQSCMRLSVPVPAQLTPCIAGKAVVVLCQLAIRQCVLRWWCCNLRCQLRCCWVTFCSPRPSPSPSPSPSPALLPSPSPSPSPSVPPSR
jgi:hypothetical protein